MPSWSSGRLQVSLYQRMTSPPDPSPLSPEQPPPPYTATCAGNGEENQGEVERPVFCTLPASILRRIHSLLPLESQVVLALVTKTTLSVLGIPTVREEQTKPILQLLDRDLTMLVYCSICNRLHGPFAVGGRMCTKQIVAEDELPPGTWGAWRFMYAFPEFSSVHAIMRSYRAGRRDYMELPSAGIGNGSPHRRTTEWLFCRGAYMESERIVPEQDHDRPATLVWMMQKIFPVSTPYSSTHDRAGKVDIVGNLYEIGCYVRWTARICNHRRWNTEYPFLLTNTADLTVSFSNGPFWARRRAVDLKTTFQDFAIHPHDFHRRKLGCTGDEVVSGAMDARLRCALYHDHGSVKFCPDNTQLGMVRSCDRCDTDFTFTVVTEEVRDPGAKGTRKENFLVFTTWKNLGSGIDREEDPVWQAHVSRTEDSPGLARSSDFFWPYTQYGKLERRPAQYKQHVYRPSLNWATIWCASIGWDRQHL